MLEDDGLTAEFWGGTTGTYEVGGLPITACRILDFGQICTPQKICVEAWASDGGCSGDTCGGACEKCKTFNGFIEVFTNTTNSTSSYSYTFSSYFNDTEPPGDVGCYAVNGAETQFVMICRSDCGPQSYNLNVDYVWFE